MLDVRTNILFDKETYQLLELKARLAGKSIGEMVRKAVQKTYKGTNEDVIRLRTEAFDEIMELRKQIKPLPKNFDYKKLINWGRRF